MHAMGIGRSRKVHGEHVIEDCALRMRHGVVLELLYL